jgi:hypothetical protein
LWVTFVALIIVLGGINLFDILVGDTVPPIVNFLGVNKTLDEYPDSDLCCDFDQDRAWVALQPALQILDVVCPEASAWAREQQSSGKIVWIPETDGAYARYDQVRMSLIINADMFALKNSERACTIAHEFRHSRQNMSKSCKSAISLLLTGKRNPDIIEDDAYFYEAKVREAIHGWQ